jgi:hypothetical protein
VGTPADCDEEKLEAEGNLYGCITYFTNPFETRTYS